MDRVQSFKGHDAVVERIKKSLYYGDIDELSEVSECPSLPLTEAVVDMVENVMKLKKKASKRPVGSRKLEPRFDLTYASTVSEKACISPCSIVLAIIYMDRLKSKNPDYLRTVSPRDLFLVSMLVASKYLFDDGEDEEVFNDEWAASASMEVRQLNKLEREFLTAIEWELYVSPDEFFSRLTLIEILVTWRQTRNRVNGLTYNELVSLAFDGSSLKIWHLLTDDMMKVLALTFATYGVLMLGVYAASSFPALFLANSLSLSASMYNRSSGTVDSGLASVRFYDRTANNNNNKPPFGLGPEPTESVHSIVRSALSTNTEESVTTSSEKQQLCNSSSSVYLIFTNLLRLKAERAFDTNGSLYFAHRAS